jgi:hypothetical protein
LRRIHYRLAHAALEHLLEPIVEVHGHGCLLCGEQQQNGPPGLDGTGRQRREKPSGRPGRQYLAVVDRPEN